MVNQHSAPHSPPPAPPATPLVVDRERLQTLIDVVQAIDHTILKQDATDSDIAAICDEARKARDLLGVGPKSVCVNSGKVAFCVERLQGSDIIVCSVVGFPLGAMTTAAKVFETECALKAGAREIDMVIDVGALRSDRSELVQREIKAIVAVCNQHGATLKVIIEACNLTEDQKVTACLAAANAGTHFVKTSTGMQKGGATLPDVKLMHETVKHFGVRVKAAGGISTVDDALAMREAGAARFGSSKLLQAIIAEVEGSGVSGNSPGTSLSSY